jgi:hypothetical protein
MKIVSDENGEVKCGSCEVYGEKCVNCTATKCRTCEEGYFVNSENGRCIPCEEVYEGCGKCTSDMCVECKVSSWTLTNYGCIDMNEYVQSTSSHGTQSESLKRSSVAAASSKTESGSSTGVIIGVVIGVLVVAAIIALVIYLIKSKHEGEEANPKDKGVIYDGDSDSDDSDEDVRPRSKKADDGDGVAFGDDIEMVVPV